MSKISGSSVSKPKVRVASEQVLTGTIADLTPDPHNANKGTERGLYLLRESIQRLGLGRSIVTDTHGTIIGGNQAHGVAGSVGLTETLIVKTTGDRLVVVQRDDLDLSADPGSPEYIKARELALADNRAGEVNLAWDAEVLVDYAEVFPLEDWFRADELGDIFESAQAVEWADVAESAEGDGSTDETGQPGSEAQQPTGIKTPLAIALSSSELKRWNAFKASCGTKGDTTAFLKLLEIQEN